MNAPLPPPKEQQDAIPELVLEKRPRAVARERNGRLPPYTGLLVVVIVASVVAIGYAIYRDTHPDVVANPATTRPSGEAPR